MAQACTTSKAENKQIEVKDHLDNIIGEYFFDGDGKRIKKVVPTTGEVTIFVYDAGGKSIAEYSTTVSNDPKVSYTTADHLGSPRILTDENGATITRRDLHPFGEEVFTTERTATLGYQSDDVRQKFTSYERDSETDLDFAQARFYNSKLGRFYSVDPEGIGAFADNPQSWNAYAYVGNNPVNITDPDGLSWYFNSSIGEAGHYMWYEDNETPADGYRLVNGAANHVYYSSGFGYVALNPTANKFQTFDTKEAALSRVIDIYRCPSCQGMVDSATENTETKGRTVRLVGAAGAVIGTCIGTAGAGCAPAIRIGIAYLQAEIEDAEVAAENTNPFAGPVTRPVTIDDSNGNAIRVETNQKVGGKPN